MKWPCCLTLLVCMVTSPYHHSYYVTDAFSIPAPSRQLGTLMEPSRASAPLPVFRRRCHPRKQLYSPSLRQERIRLTTKADGQGNNDPIQLGMLERAAQKFVARPLTYLTIPVIAAIVGWFTNYLAVQMIFYPIRYRGIPLWRRDEIPLGFIGWQGIVPCKTRTMSVAMVDMVTSQLLTVRDAFARLDAKTMAKLLSSRVPEMGTEVITESFPNSVSSWPIKLWGKISRTSMVKAGSVPFLTTLIRDVQTNIDSVFSLQSCVVDQMVQDRAKLGELFRKVGQTELDFLVNSGLWFGFLLGIIQMAVALVWENPWSLSIGGTIVGLATNWLALKWIFEPINPTKIGPFILQGQFLRRQKEVAAEFANFFSNKILSSPKLWNSILTDPTTTPSFVDLLTRNLKKVCNIVSFGLFKGVPSPEVIGKVAGKTMEKLPNHVHVLHEYIDKNLGLEKTLRVKMEAMSAVKFERVLHPIFEEDELTLILAGGVLGFLAGLVQQGIETGTIKLSNPIPKVKALVVFLVTAGKTIVGRIRGKKSPPTGNG